MEAERSRSRDSYKNKRSSSPSAPVHNSTELYVTFLPSNVIAISDIDLGG